LAAPAAAHAGRSYSLEEVLTRQEHAIGDLQALRTLILDVRMEEPDAAYDLTWRMLRPDRMRVDLRKLGVPVYSEGLGSRGPWQQHLLQRSARPTSTAGAEAITNGVEGATWGRSLREMRARGHSLTLLSAADRGEIGVRVVFRNGTRRDYFIDSHTFRIVRSLQTYALHPDMKGEAAKPRTIETTHGDYRRVAGYFFPMRLENRDRDSGEIIQTVVVRDLRVNEPLEPGIFDSR
jgi:hypothetical protein